MQVVTVVLVLVSATLSAQPVRLLLQPGGQYETTYTLSTGPVLRATVRLSGHMDAKVLLDREGSRVTNFRFTGGRVAYSNETAKALLVPFPPTYAEISTRNVAALFWTPGDGLPPVDPVAASLDNLQHRFSQNEGEVITRILVGSVEAQKEVRDLAARPDTNPLFGTTRVHPVLISENALARRHRIELIQTGGEPRSQPVPEFNATLTILEEGGFSAHGEVVGPSRAMIEWAELGGLPMPVAIDETHPSSGLPLGVLFSLGLSPHEARHPLKVDPVARVARLELPPGGPIHPVDVELLGKSGSWEKLLTVSPGDGGARQIPLPDTSRVLVRLKVSTH